jgi:hypothetical protein
VLACDSLIVYRVRLIRSRHASELAHV